MGIIVNNSSVSFPRLCSETLFIIGWFLMTSHLSTFLKTQLTYSCMEERFLLGGSYALYDSQAPVHMQIINTHLTTEITFLSNILHLDIK